MDVLLGLATLGVTVFLLAFFGPRYLRFRGRRMVICPETKQPAAVNVGASKAALGGGFRLSDCDRWPEREGCGQECLAEINAAPDGCLVRERLAAWYAGKSCVYCHAALSEVEWHEHRPCVLMADGTPLEWHEISPVQIAGGLEGCQPLCWRCHIVQTFRRKYPELVIDR
jgi:hypothetical protein